MRLFQPYNYVTENWCEGSNMALRHLVSNWLSGYVAPLYPAIESFNLSSKCLHCGLPNFSTTLFDSYVEISNIYSALDSLVESDLNVSQLGEPTATSSLARPTKVNNNYTKKQTPLRILNIKHLLRYLSIFARSSTLNFAGAVNNRQKITVDTNNLVSSEFPNRSSRRARSFISILNFT